MDNYKKKLCYIKDQLLAYLSDNGVCTASAFSTVFAEERRDDILQLVDQGFADSNENMQRFFRIWQNRSPQLIFTAIHEEN